MSSGNFASLTAGLLVRKGEGKPSTIMASEMYRAPQQRVAEATAQAPTPPEQERQIPTAPTIRPAPAKEDKPRRLVVNLTPKEYETIGILAVKKGTTPHLLLRQALDDSLALFVAQCNGSCKCLEVGLRGSPSGALTPCDSVCG